MQDSDWQKNLELVVKVLLGVVAGIVALWLAGWVLRLISMLFLGVAGLFVALLKFVVPVAILAGIVYVVIGALRPKPVSAGASPVVLKPASSESAIPVAPAGRTTVEIPVNTEAGAVDATGSEAKLDEPKA